MTDVYERSLGDIVASNPSAARALDAHGLDYCCHGSATLARACSDAGLDAAAVAHEIAETDGLEEPWTALDPPVLADHIVMTHHAYLSAELPQVDALSARVVDVHGERHPELHEVRRLVAELRAELEPHMLKEERVLFPAIHALWNGQTQFPFGSIANPIRMMVMEHGRAGQLLADLRAATGGYVVPSDGCASYRALYARLDAIERGTHEHIHKENHVLFDAVLRRTET
jgi:regulator of cell morphogenesis and NO signaling